MSRPSRPPNHLARQLVNLGKGLSREEEQRMRHCDEEVPFMMNAASGGHMPNEHWTVEELTSFFDAEYKDAEARAEDVANFARQSVEGYWRCGAALLLLRLRIKPTKTWDRWREEHGITPQRCDHCIAFYERTKDKLDEVKTLSLPEAKRSVGLLTADGRRANLGKAAPRTSEGKEKPKVRGNRKRVKLSEVTALADRADALAIAFVNGPVNQLDSGEVEDELESIIISVETIRLSLAEALSEDHSVVAAE